MREILQSRQSSRGERKTGRNENISKSPSDSPRVLSDSDKENSRASKRRREPAADATKNSEARSEEGEKRAAVTSVTSVTSVPPLRLTVTEGEEAACDWAYWYQPDTGSVTPAKVTVRSRPAPHTGARQRSQNRIEKSLREGTETATVTQEKPWRTGMKKTEKEAVVVAQDKIPDKAEPVKPWRANMRKEPRPVKAVEDVRPKTEERAWRNNMKKDKPAQNLSQPGPVRRRHYDRKEVRQFMKDKKVREKEENEEREKQESLNKEVVKRRLQELDKLQKQIAEADVRQLRNLGRTERKLTEEGQEALREKLMELTEQMKSRWRERDRPENEWRSNGLAPPASLPHRSNFSDKEVTGESQRNALRLAPVEPQQLQESSVISMSEVSDATEIKSLSENPRNISSRTEEGSQMWRDRLAGKDLEETVPTFYRQLEKPANVPTPLTDELPVRENSRSEKLRSIVKDVLDRHKSDIDFIRTNLKDVDIPDSLPLLSGQEFLSKYPTILTTPPSLPELESRPRPVPSDFHMEPSNDSHESENAPQWIDVTKENSDIQIEVNNLSATVYKKLPLEKDELALERKNEDKNTFMKTVVRKYEAPAPNNTSIPSDMAISEGLLSDTSVSSPPSPPPVDSKTYSKDDPEVLGEL